MDWIKVKVKHVDYDFAGCPDNVLASWIRIMTYVAAIERKPLRNALRKKIGENNVNDVENWLKNNRIKLDDVIAKVLEDVDYVNLRKYRNRKYMRKYRHNPLRKPLRKALRVGQREEKRREEKNTVIREENFPFLKDISFLNTFNSYLKGRKIKATEHAKELILKDLHKYDVAIATAMLEESIKHGWRGVFPLKEKQGAKWNDL